MDEQPFTITVDEQNLRPTISGPGLPWPYAWPAAYQVDFGESTQQDQPLTFTVTASDNDYGPDNTPQTLAFEKVSGPGTINPATGEYTWLVPYNTPVSTVDVTLRVRHGSQGAYSYHDVVVPMAITRSYLAPDLPTYAPVANSDAWSIVHGQTLQGVNILANDQCATALPIIDSYTTPSQGSLSIDSAGNLMYAAPGNYAGAVVVNYTLMKYS